MLTASWKSSANPPKPLPNTMATRASSTLARARMVRAACSARAYKLDTAGTSNIVFSLAKVGFRVALRTGDPQHCRSSFLLIWNTEGLWRTRRSYEASKNDDCQNVGDHLNKLDGNILT